MLMLGEGVEAQIAKEFKDACLGACKALIESAPKSAGGTVKG